MPIRHLCKLAFIPAALIVLPLSGQAEVKLPAIFSDHMVLQEEATIPVWGKAAAGEKITVTFGNEKAAATAGADGAWRADLPALPAGTPPGTLVVTGQNALTFNDVLVGDVWLCSGQSNMEFQVGKAANANEAVPAATDNQIRLFHVPNTVAIAPRDDVKAKWLVCTPQTVASFTAVGYFFGEHLRSEIKRPIGLIDSCVGGTPAESWTDLATLKANPTLEHYADSFAKLAAQFPGGDTEFATKAAAYEEAVRNMREANKTDPTYQAALTQWQQAAAQAKAAGQPAPPQPRAPAPPSLGVPQTAPTVLFDGMIAPLIPFAIKGAIWYQGESNASSPAKAAEYATLFPAMITDWRGLWKEGDFPFVFVQLANFQSGTAPWPEIREAQLETLRLPKTGMAVAIDIGTGGNIHPPDKDDVGRRLALAALHVAYGEKLVYTGPIYQGMQVEGGAIRISFAPDSVGGGLTIGTAPWTDPKAAPLSTTSLEGFQIAGADKKWAPAKAKIEGSAVVVSSPEVTSPVAVRYGWATDPRCNLYNKEGLPASPFRTDDWERAPAATPGPASR
jgi:sialate O-acetylesterase